MTYFQSEYLGRIRPSDVSYSIALYHPTGRPILPVVPFISAEWARAVNEVSNLTMMIPTDKVSEQMLTSDCRFEIWRKPGRSMASLEGETTWILREKNFVFEADGRSYWKVVAPDANIILKARIVAAHDGTSQAEKTDEADDMMKSIMTEQFGSSASGSRNISAFLSIQGSTGLGPSITKAFAYMNVFDVFQDIVQTSYTLGTPIYFDIVMNGSTMQFQTFKNQRGTDRRASSNRKLMVGPKYRNVGDFTVFENYSEEYNYVYAIGPSVYGARLVATAEDTTRSTISPFALRETAIDASSTDTSATGLTREAQSLLYASRPRRAVEGSMRNTAECAYGRDWRFGDRMTFERDDDLMFDVRVEAVQVSVSDGVENVQAYFRGDRA